jgi:outer membrane protein insertion porin family
VGKISAGWQRIGGSRNDFLGSVGLGELQREGYTERSRFLSLQLQRRLSRRSVLSARYRVKDVTLEDVSLSEEEVPVEEGWLASVGASVVRDGLDDLFNPRSGGISAVDLAVYSGAVGSDADFTRLFMGHFHFWPFWSGDVVVSSGARVGFSWEFGDTEQVPVTERFYAGGIDTVRGYEQDRLGPLDPKNDDPTGGAAMIVLNQEVRFRLTDELNFHLFLDAGNVFGDVHDAGLGDLQYTAGPGFSYNTPAGPLRLYYGFKLNPEDDEPSGRFHFTFGWVF